jgi:hypothetical protein
MKKIILLPILLSLFLTSCEFVFEPQADFGVSKNPIDVNETIYFYNSSTQADEYEWDFGDGYSSYDFEPVHSYSRPGTYIVQLSAFHRGLVSYSYFTVEVLEPPTILDIQVLEYYKKYPVEGASIIVYRTYSDWYYERNKITEVFTDRNGIVRIDGLTPGFSYYIDVWEQNHTNYDLAKEDINFIITPTLEYGQTTYFTAYVDYVPSTLKSKSTSRRSLTVEPNTKRVYSSTMNVREKR